VGLSPRTTTSATARVTIYPGPRLVLFLDTYSGDTHYTSATDNDTATECLDVTSSSASYGSVIGGNAHASIVVAPATTPGPASTRYPAARRRSPVSSRPDGNGDAARQRAKDTGNDDGGCRHERTALVDDDDAARVAGIAHTRADGAGGDQE